MRIFYLGDIHGNFGLIGQYIDLYDIKDAHIIQVGDFGVGFSTFEKEKRMLEMYHHKLVKKNVFVWAIRGNHDYRPYFDNDPFGFTNIKLVKDYEVLELERNRILCVGGAVSVDRTYRYTKRQKSGDMVSIGGESWWPDEVFELDIDKIKDLKDINIVVTHTCPAYCPPDNTFGFGPFVEGIIRDTGDAALKTDLMLERSAMSELFHILKLNGNNPAFAYYGHFHKSDVQSNDGCTHRLLNVGELWEER